MTDSSARSPVDWIAAAVVALALVLYATTTNPNIEWDGVYHCVWVASGEPTQLMQPQHLLYGVAGYATRTLLSAVRPCAAALDALLLLSAVTGAMCLGVFYWACRRLGLERIVAAGCGLALGFSLEFWRHAVNVEYIVPNAFVVSLFFAASVVYAQDGHRGHGLWLGAALGLAILAHLRHALLVPAALVLVLSARRRWLRLAGLTGAAMLVAGGGYVLAGWVAFRTVAPGRILGWALSAPGGTVGKAGVWWVWKTRSLLWAPIWQMGAVIDVAHVRHLLWAQDRFNGVAPVLAAAVLTAVVGGAVMGVYTVRRGPTAWRRMVAVAVAWLVPYWIFFSFWCPSEEAWWVVGLIPLWALFGLGLERLSGAWIRTRRIGLTAGIVLMLAVLNASGHRGVFSQSRNLRPEFSHLFHLHRNARVGDLVLWLGYLQPRIFGSADRDVSPGIQDRCQALDQASTFAPVRSRGTLEVLRTRAAILCEIADTLKSGRTVWVSLAGGSPDRTVGWAHELHPASARALSDFLAEFDLVPSGTEGLWRLEPRRAVDPVLPFVEGL